MAEKTPVKSPPPTPVNTQALDDFARLNKGMDAALSQIITEPPSGPVPPVVTPGVDKVPVAPGQPPIGGKRNLEEESLLAYRAMLAQEEQRLAQRTEHAAPLVYPQPQSVVPSQFGVGAAELVIREGADPLLVESFKILRRLVASGVAMTAGFDPRQLFSHMEKLRAAIEYVPKKETK